MPGWQSHICHAEAFMTVKPAPALWLLFVNLAILTACMFSCLHVKVSLCCTEEPELALTFAPDARAPATMEA
jgi:hypothetical protein